MRQYFLNFFKYKDLLWELVARDLKTKYRRSVLGFVWSLLNPLLMMLVISAVFSTLFRFDIPNFPIYLLTGQIIFGFFSEATTIAMSSIINGGSLIKKVYIPKYIFPLSRTLSSFINLLFALLAIVIVMFFTKTPVTPVIFLFPLPLIYIFIFSVGMSFIVSVLAVFFRDMIHLYGILLTVWMYFTPIFYPVKIIPENLQIILNNNPMYYYIECFRDIVLYGRFPSLQLHLICLAYGIGVLFVGTIVFVKNQDKFILHI